jgi:hypothetical protein
VFDWYPSLRGMDSENKMEEAVVAVVEAVEARENYYA